MHLFVSPAFAGLFIVVDLSSHCALHSTGWVSSGQIAGTTVATFSFHGYSVLCLQLNLNLSLHPSPCANLAKVWFHLTCLLWLIVLSVLPLLLLTVKICSLITVLFFSVFCDFFYYLYHHVSIIQPMYKLHFQLSLFLYNCILQWLFWVCLSTLMHFHLNVWLACGIVMM